MKHSLSCEYPEGCSCGAREHNDLVSKVRLLKYENLRLKEALEKCSSVFTLFRAVRGGDGALKPAVEAVNKALGKEPA